MLEARDAIEQEIWREPTMGSSNIWFDNWSRLGASYYVVYVDFPINEKGDIEKLMTEDKWNSQKLESVLPSDITQHIMDNIIINQNASPWDLPWWLPTTNGKFSVSSAY